MDNSAGHAEAYREVIHEDKLRIKGVDKDQVKAPDYAFRLSGGKRLFFMKAKKPSVAVKDAKLQAKITQPQSRIRHHEQRVNELVYKVYHLTPGEIALVEGG